MTLRPGTHYPHVKWAHVRIVCPWLKASFPRRLYLTKICHFCIFATLWKGYTSTNTGKYPFPADWLYMRHNPKYQQQFSFIKSRFVAFTLIALTWNAEEVKNWQVYWTQMSAKWTSRAKIVAIFHLAPFWLRNYGHTFKLKQSSKYTVRVQNSEHCTKNRRHIKHIRRGCARMSVHVWDDTMKPDTFWMGYNVGINLNFNLCVHSPCSV
jgi:hypothetical protein